jgi:hypothetical protein
MAFLSRRRFQLFSQGVNALKRTTDSKGIVVEAQLRSGLWISAQLGLSIMLFFAFSNSQATSVSSTMMNCLKCGCQLKLIVLRSFFFALRTLVDRSMPRISFEATPSVNAVLQTIGGEEYVDPLYVHSPLVLTL